MTKEDKEFYSKFYAGKVGYVKSSGVMVAAQRDSRRGAANRTSTDTEVVESANSWKQGDEIYGYENRKGEKARPLDKAGMLRLRRKYHGREPVP